MFLVDEDKGHLVMEKVDGKTVKQFLFEASDAGTAFYLFQRRGLLVWHVGGDDQAAKRIATKIGTAIARLHDSNVVHGDLTTSNMMLENKTGRLVGIYTD